MSLSSIKQLELASDDLLHLREARHCAPHKILGPHPQGKGRAVVRVFLPQAVKAWLEESGAGMESDGSGLFTWTGAANELPTPYSVRYRDEQGTEHLQQDPYAFGPDIDNAALQNFSEGRHHRAWQMLGSHPYAREGVEGTRFAVWAPNAGRVSVVGDFNAWDGRRHPMSCRGSSGVWELFVPGVGPGALYKYEIRHGESGTVFLRADPFARQFETPPQPASVVAPPSGYRWGDGDWPDRRPDWQQAPIAIYEVHLGSWQRGEAGELLDYRQLAQRLVDYLHRTGFTHVQLMPVTEYPFDGSWGYQCTGYFAATVRHGNEEDLRYLVDCLHQHGIGVYMDWVPGHFPKDDQALALFDGTPLYEHQDARMGEHKEWGTLVFNFGRNEVRSFLVSSALYWLEQFHFDGLRVDAVASMLYLDYGREDDWVPNRHGGNENLEAIQFLQELNTVTHRECPGTVTIAEESTAWPQVTRPVWVGGLGFSMKWNMGWMNDTLAYLEKEPVHRHYHHDAITFAIYYAFDENFILPLSHDEVVHGKRSLLSKMPGDRWQQFANLRLLYTCMYTFPGKKLLFMGDEFGANQEWDHDANLDWDLLGYPEHAGLLKAVADLNRLYLHCSELHRYDFQRQGFEWIDCHDAAQSLLCFRRCDGENSLIVVLNFTPVPRHGYRVGVPEPGLYLEMFNSDSRFYGGSDLGNGQGLQAEQQPWMNQPCSLALDVPPLGGVILARNSRAKLLGKD